MKAIILKDFGGTENLVHTELPTPAIKNDEVLVKLESISINPVDIKTRMGRGTAGLIKDHLPAIIGWDMSGIITEAGVDVGDFKIGDEVFAMLNFPVSGKTYAEYVVASPDQLALKPANISHHEAAGATLAALTAYQALTYHADVKKGDRVLIHAGAGGVGHYAIQLAKYLGAYVIATSSLTNKDFLLDLGADEHIDYKSVPFETASQDINFVLDTIGDEYIDRSLKVMQTGGTIVSLVTGRNEMVGEKAEALGMIGRTMKVFPSGKDMKIIADLLAEGRIRSHISETLPFADMAKAHDLIESGKTIGKITLRF